MTWTALTSTAATYSNITSGAGESWTATGSNTTHRNTSFFVLHSPVGVSGGVNLQPAFRSTAASGRGGGFYWTSTDAIAYLTSGDSLA